MKSLLVTLVLFGLLWYGCHDVQAFKPIRRILRRAPKAKASQPEVHEAPQPVPDLGRRRYR
jgi:hypothetical protein